MVVFVMNVWEICYYEVLAKNETMNAARCLEFLKRSMDSWQGNRSMQPGYLMTTPDFINTPQLRPGLSKEIYNIGFFQ